MDIPSNNQFVCKTVVYITEYPYLHVILSSGASGELSKIMRHIQKTDENILYFATKLSDADGNQDEIGYIFYKKSISLQMRLAGLMTSHNGP